MSWEGGVGVVWAEKKRRRSPAMTTEGGVEVMTTEGGVEQQLERKARQGSREGKKDTLGPL